MQRGFFPVVEASPPLLPTESVGENRAVSFLTSEAFSEIEDLEGEFSMGISSGKPTVVANFTNPEEFFSELEKYFSELRPLERLNNIERLTESYKKTLLENSQSGGNYR